MFNKRHALLPIQDQRRVGACHAPYAYKGACVQSRMRARSIAPACSARTRVRACQPHARLASSPGLPDLNGHVHVHMLFGAGRPQLGLKSSHSQALK